MPDESPGRRASLRLIHHILHCFYQELVATYALRLNFVAESVIVRGRSLVDGLPVQDVKKRAMAQLVAEVRAHAQRTGNAAAQAPNQHYYYYGVGDVVETTARRSFNKKLEFTLLLSPPPP